jgi:murein DD-endopeptidase MepM/ murein hydrolase activator NlpD
LGALFAVGTAGCVAASAAVATETTQQQTATTATGSAAKQAKAVSSGKSSLPIARKPVAVIRPAKSAAAVPHKQTGLTIMVAHQDSVPGHGGRLIIVGHQEAPPQEAPPQVTTASGGFDLDRFMAGLGLRSHQSGIGGPYVALGPASPAATNAETEALVRTVPLAAPLDQYQLESHFGVRVDPINGHHAMHTGLDLSAPYRAPVYSTSPGEVVFAGYAAAYGRMIEIDHGNGIHTRYAHLNRLLVSKGQHVRGHEQVGLLGSTGRSTGPHVHYEVLVNGVAQDPARFLAAGKSVELMRTAQ